MAYQPYVAAIIGQLIGANLNTTSDQAIPIQANKYIFTQIIATNASTTPTLAQGGIYTATSKGGTAVVSAAQLYTALSSATVTLNVAVPSGTFTANTLYLSLTTANGGAATCDIYIVGYRLN